MSISNICIKAKKPNIYMYYRVAIYLENNVLKEAKQNEFMGANNEAENIYVNAE